MKLSFWRKTAAVLMAALLALSTPVLALSETVEAAATAETTAAPAATETPVVTKAPVETEATTAPEATEAAETTVPETTNASQEAPAKAAPIELLPIDGDVSINARKPSKLQKTNVDKMQIRAFAMGSEKYGSEMSSCSPSVKAKGVSYEIGAVEGSEEEGWYTTVTFHFKSGDAFELKARDNFNTLYPWSDKLNGDWAYHFTDEHPADQVLTFGWVNNSWKAKYPDGHYSNNIISETANIIYVYLSLPAAAEYTVTYTDGANGAVFADQSYTVKEGDATPAFNGEPTREGYTFVGWQPEVAATVTANATYTAQWKLAQPATPSGSNSIKELFKFHCVTTPDEHADQTYNWFGSFVKYNGDMAWDETRGVYTATAKITNVQTMLSSGVKSPEKVWGCTHYHTDADGKKVMTATIKLVWDPSADGLNAAGTQTHGLWLPDGEQLVNVWHATQPSAPTIPGLTPRSMGSTVAIRVKDSNGKLNDVVTYFRTLPYCPAGTYAFGPMTKDENGDFWCDLTISNLDYFVSDFNGRNNVSYKIDTAKTTTTFVYKLKYVGDKVNYKQDGTGWTVDSSSWTNGETQKISKILYVAKPCTITYTDGVNGTAFADQVYTDVLEGSATPAFVGKPTREGYVFTGWDPEVAQTVNGDATYTAKWGEDKNDNGLPDDLEDKFIVTYTDGVNGEAFEDQVYSDLLSGLDTPAFNGTPARKGYVFRGWNPAVTDKVSESVIYTAQWEQDENNNGIPDKEEERYSVTYTDGVSGEAFEDQVYSDLLEGLNTPAFNGTPERKGYVFAGWEPEVAQTVSGNATYTAKWDEDKNNNGKPDKDEKTYTVIYTDGVADEEVFADQKTEGLLEGLDTPAFNGTPERKGYVFAGWQPEVAKTVSGDATYTALWTADKNGNGVPDDQEEHFTVTYTDGAKKHTAFADQVFTGLVKGEATPSFDGKPTRKGYKFLGWKPEVEQTVSGNATYTAQWSKIESTDEDEVPKTGDTTASSMATMLMSLACMGLAVMLLLARSKAQKNR
ncbi:MAG: InlB B-repeat-containing protein [Eubacteriales bacterium]|nr:InlB B-repeat-containing protein [Eubacteriales bacterium]